MTCSQRANARSASRTRAAAPAGGLTILSLSLARAPTRARVVGWDKHSLSTSGATVASRRNRALSPPLVFAPIQCDATFWARPWEPVPRPRVGVSGVFRIESHLKRARGRAAAGRDHARARGCARPGGASLSPPPSPPRALARADARQPPARPGAWRSAGGGEWRPRAAARARPRLLCPRRRRRRRPHSQRRWRVPTRWWPPWSAWTRWCAPSSRMLGRPSERCAATLPPNASPLRSSSRPSGRRSRPSAQPWTPRGRRLPHIRRAQNKSSSRSASRLPPPGRSSRPSARRTRNSAPRLRRPGRRTARSSSATRRSWRVRGWRRQRRRSRYVHAPTRVPMGAHF